jgi:glycosyltransferase involved in cell wall biosynthesis
VVTVHHLEAAESEGVEELQRAAVQGADARATATRFWAERIGTLFGTDADVIPNGVDTATFGAGPGRAAAGARLGWGPRPVVLGLGGIARRKGSRLLIEAFARARSRLGAEPLLAVAGATPAERADPYARAFVEDAERLGLVVADHPHSYGADIVLLGPIPAASMPVLVRAADVLAVPSTREGSPLAVLEAAVAGRASVVSDLPSLRETLTHGVHALMVPPGEPGPLADAIVGLVRSPGLAAGLARAAAEVAQERTWPATAAAYRALYEREPAEPLRR